MTDLKRNVAYHVTEVRQRETLNGVTENNGTVYLGQNGKDMILSYFPKTNAVVESRDNSCRLTSIRNFPEIFWGWNQLTQRSEDIIIGPAALIRRFFTSNQMQRLQNGERGRHGSEFDIWEACEEDSSVFSSTCQWLPTPTT
ncbi:hypothetical protein SK128_003237 [Halocaridina rubra]|uniref:Uncharacterized protein n=1 Tax=Halocaridina rubra TaxID=373956 RepID=A0AAN9ABK6_HALRR